MSSLCFLASSEQHLLPDESPQNHKGNIGQCSHLPHAALSGPDFCSHMHFYLSFSIDGDNGLSDNVDSGIQFFENPFQMFTIGVAAVKGNSKVFGNSSCLTVFHRR